MSYYIAKGTTTLTILYYCETLDEAIAMASALQGDIYESRTNLKIMVSP